MANEQNLIPNKDRTPEELREMTRKGGIASGKARREKKTMRENLRMLLEMGLTDVEAMELKARGILSEDLVTMTYLNNKQIEKAKNGDTSAYLAIRDTIGEKPTNNLNVNGELSNTISIEFVRTGNDIKEREDDISDE